MKSLLKILILGMMATTTISQARNFDQRVSDYLQAVENAKAKVQRFKEAVKSGDPMRIKRETLNIQEDPAAIKELNKGSSSVKKKFVETTESIQTETIENIKKNYAEKYNEAHPETKISPKDVEVKKFTNPSSEIKAGHDWDVTVSVKGKDVPYTEVEAIVHEAYFDTAGGNNAYPDSNPKKFSKAHHVEVTDGISHAEGYEGGGEYIKDPKKYKIKDAERLTKTIEHKSHLDQKNSAEYAGKGEYSKSEVYKHEQARQYTKQYEKHIKPRIKEMHGRIPITVQDGTKILKKIGKYDAKLKRTYTPADADADLAKLGEHGETIESIIKKGSSLVEAGQKLKAPTKEMRLKEKLRDANEAVKSAKESGNSKKLRKAQKKVARTKQELQEIESSKPVKSAKESGNSKKPRKAQRKVAQTKQELQELEPNKPVKSPKQTETLKAKAGRIANEYMEGAIIWHQTQKIREGIKEGDNQKVKAAVLGEDTVNRLEGKKEYINDADKYESAKKDEVLSALTNKLKRMGATKEEIKSFRDNYGKDRRKTSQIIVQVKSRGGKDISGHRPLEADGKMDDTMSGTDRAKEGLKQAGSYGKDMLDMVSLGGASRGDEGQKDLDDSVKQSDRVFTETENSVIGKLYTELRDRGASKEEARAALKNYRNDKRGVRELVAELKERDPKRAKGSNRKREGLSADNVDIKEDDDGWLSRVEESFVNAGKSMKEMLYDSPKKFLDDTGKDLAEISNDAMEIVGIGSEKNQKEIYAGIKNKEYKNQYKHKYDGLIGLGASDKEARKALSGKQGSVGKLIKSLRDKEKTTQRKKEELAKKAKALMAEADRFDKEAEAEAKAARKRLEEKIAQSKRKELSDKAKALIAQAEQTDKEVEIEANAARKRLEEKIAQSKQEDLSQKARALIAQAEQTDREAEMEAEAARKRLEEKIAQSKKEDLSQKARALIAQAEQTDKQISRKNLAYGDMNSAQKHKALMNNNNEAWEKLTEGLVKDLGMTMEQEKKIAQLSGVISGGWSGKDKNGWKANGSFTMRISSSGKITGKYSGDASGVFRGYINSSGRMDMKLGGGRVHGGRWSGSVRKTENGALVGSGSWKAEGYHGGWRGSGR